MNYKLNVVLVRTLYDRNIGFCSRAMSNMGAHQLILIQPQCEMTYEAQQAAATGQDGLRTKKIYSSIEEFLMKEPDGLRISFSARDGRGRSSRDFKETLLWSQKNSPYFKNSNCLKSSYHNTDEKSGNEEVFSSTDEKTEEEIVELVPIYLFFGPEDAGLSAAEIQNSHFCCSLPTYGENASLNLSQAVLLCLFIFRETLGGAKTILNGQQELRKNDQLPASIDPAASLKEWLIALGVDLSSKKINAYTVLKRMLLQNTPSVKEYQMLETMIQQTLRKLKKLKDLELKEKNQA